MRTGWIFEFVYVTHHRPVSTNPRGYLRDFFILLNSLKKSCDESVVDFLEVVIYSTIWKLKSLLTIFKLIKIQYTAVVHLSKVYGKFCNIILLINLLDQIK